MVKLERSDFRNAWDVEVEVMEEVLALLRRVCPSLEDDDCEYKCMLVQLTFFMGPFQRNANTGGSARACLAENL